MKRAIVILLIAVMAVNAWSASEVVDGVTWSYETFSDGSKTCARIISGAVGNADDLTIPSFLGGCEVTSIGDSAFIGCSGLTSVTIPSSVTSIGSYVFYDCSGLKSVTIPSSVTSIGNSAFSYCFGLTAVHIFDLSAWSRIVFGVGAYADTERLLSNPLTYAQRLFLNGTEIVRLDIPSDVTSIGDCAFAECSGLTSVTIPSSVTSIGSYAFYNCSGLTSVTIPSSVTSIGSAAFYNCSGLTSVTIPSSVTSIGSSAFSGCTGLTSVTIPEGVTSIGEYAFSSCSGLTSVAIPEGVTSIGSYVFSGCSGLTSVTIPSSVTSIGYSAFSGCSGLKSVTIPSSVTSIGNSAFSYCFGLTSVTIPSSVTSIGSYAFYNCSGLTSVTIPSSVTSIGADAFYNCSGLTSVTIPSSVTSIGSYAFYGCSGLKSVVFLGAPPDGLGGSELLSYGRKSYPREYGKDWLKFRGINLFTGYGQGEKPTVKIVSALIREDDPTVMDVVYKVVSARPTVKVRTLAFQDGERSFAKVVRPTEFVEDTAKNIGDEITANEEHKLSWRVSADWKADLAKVKFEVLALDGDLLPLELTTLPKIGDHAAMEISWNVITSQQVFDALLWCYADGDAGLTLSNGVLKNGTVQLVNKTSLSAANAIGYVYGKMGFLVLSGNELKYANEMTRLGLSPSGVRQYAWRTVEE